MRKVTPEQITQRREEIINACEQLYQTTSFRDITLKEIGNLTSFSRPTIYNYFETKEEIFLGLFQREYDRWNEDLTAILNGNEQMTKAELAEKEGFTKFVSIQGHYNLTEISEKHGVTMTEVSLAWLLTKVTSPVVGATKMHHIEGAAKAVDLELTDEELANLEEPYVPHPLAGVMAQNKPSAAKEKHVWSTGDQKIRK